MRLRRPRGSTATSNGGSPLICPYFSSASRHGSIVASSVELRGFWMLALMLRAMPDSTRNPSAWPPGRFGVGHPGGTRAIAGGGGGPLGSGRAGTIGSALHPIQLSRERRSDASLRGHELLLQPGCEAPRSDGERPHAPGDARSRGPGRGRDRARLGEDRQLHRLPGPARQCPRALQGRPALSPGRRSGRSPIAGQPDDLEDGDRRPALRRRQGGSQLRSQQALPGRAGAADAQVHREDPRHDRAAQGHPRAGHGDRRAGDGLDHERIRQV